MEPTCIFYYHHYAAKQYGALVVPLFADHTGKNDDSIKNHFSDTQIRSIVLMEGFNFTKHKDNFNFILKT